MLPVKLLNVQLQYASAYPPAPSWNGTPLVVGLGTKPVTLGPAPTPFAFVTNSREPSPLSVTEVGYQAVGMRPRTAGEPASSSPRRPPSWTTVTSSAPASATNSLLPSRLSARPSGLLLSGAPR